MLLFFFFQAEDGIRDYKVTGVQTCALPILSHGLTRGEVELLAKLKNKRAVPFGPAARLGVDAPGLQRLQRSGLIEIREITAGRKRKVQRIVAWKAAAASAADCEGDAHADRTNVARRVA